MCLYEIMWKNVVERGRSLVTRQYGACVLLAGELRAYKHARTNTHTQNM